MTTVYDGRSVMMMTLSKDDLELAGDRSELVSEVRRRSPVQSFQRQDSEFALDSPGSFNQEPETD